MRHELAERPTTSEPLKDGWLLAMGAYCLLFTLLVGLLKACA